MEEDQAAVAGATPVRGGSDSEDEERSMSSEEEADEVKETSSSRYKLSLDKVDDLLKTIHTTLNITEDKAQLSLHDGRFQGMGLLWMMMAVVSSVMVLVRPVRYITGPIRCINPDDILNVYRECEGKDGIDVLFTFHCGSNSVKFCKPGILLNTSSHCWTHLDDGNDSCVYKTGYHKPGMPDFTIDVRVLDRVLIFNITMNHSRLGLDMAVSVQFSGEESAVTWEVDGELFLKGYRLIDGNRTLIIPSVQRDDAERRFQVRITNLVIEDTWNCQLAIGVSDPVFLFNITCNSSRLGEDMDVSVLLSEEDKSVAKYVDWVPLSEKYQLMGDNGTLRDAKRRSGVGITMTIPEETWNYWRKNRV
ncbi:uncharacterized protein LOC143981511 [Lithobates pipiens]